MKKSTTSHRDTVAEAMGVNPATLPPAPVTPPPAIVVPYAPIPEQYGEIKSIDADGEEFINLYSNLYAVDRTSAVALSADKPVDWVLPGLRRGQVGFLVSPGGVGKSFWSLQAGYSIATGVDLIGLERMGHTITQGRVLYLSFEDDRIDLDGRIRKIFKQFKGLHDNNALHKMGQCETVAMRGGVINLMHEECLVNFTKDMGEYRLIVVDTLSQAHKGKENDNVEMASLIQNLQDFAIESNTALLVLHHASKAAVLNNQGDSSGAGRGASALNFNVRANFYMQTLSVEDAKTVVDSANPHINFDDKTERKKYVCWGTSKVNNVADMDGFWFKKHEGVLVPVKLTTKDKNAKPKTKKADIIDSKILGDKYVE